MAFEHRYRRMAQFAETDMAGIVHFSQFLRYAEEAEHAFLRSAGLAVHSREDASAYGFPRIAVRCEYRRPIRFEDEFEVHIWLHRKGPSALTYQFTIENRGEVAARGEVQAICCRRSGDRQLEVIPLPKDFAETLEEAPYPPLAFRER
jgi:YbgC/YbaW family acyl-CoA thioester hydrolase